MQVFGYTPNKIVIGVDLTPKQIVENGIDPWRLDLFDEGAVTLEVQVGSQMERLRFTRLRDISFLYSTPEKDTSVVGFYDGQTAACVTGVNNSGQSVDMHFENVKATGRPFSEHFEEYLELMNQQSEQRPNVVSQPALAAAVKIQGSEVTFDWRAQSLAFHSPNYAGEMFNEVSVPAHLPEEVNWIVDRFKQWQPSVLGKVLRPDRVRFKSKVWILVEEGVKEFLAALPRDIHKFDSASFVYQDFTFKVALKGQYGTLHARALARLDRPLSIDVVHCRKPDELLCSRVAAFDRSKKQARLLGEPDHEDIQLLHAAGFRVLRQ